MKVDNFQLNMTNWLHITPSYCDSSVCREYSWYYLIATQEIAPSSHHILLACNLYCNFWICKNLLLLSLFCIIDLDLSLLFFFSSLFLEFCNLFCFGLHDANYFLLIPWQCHPTSPSKAFRRFLCSLGLQCTILCVPFYRFDESHDQPDSTSTLLIC